MSLIVINIRIWKFLVSWLKVYLWGSTEINIKIYWTTNLLWLKPHNLFYTLKFTVGLQTATYFILTSVLRLSSQLFRRIFLSLLFLSYSFERLGILSAFSNPWASFLEGKYNMNLTIPYSIRASKHLNVQNVWKIGDEDIRQNNHRIATIIDKISDMTIACHYSHKLFHKLN